MSDSLLEKVGGINLRGGKIEDSSFRKYQERVTEVSSDCCYGADCGDCDCGGYCIDPD